MAASSPLRSKPPQSSTLTAPHSAHQVRSFSMSPSTLPQGEPHTKPPMLPPEIIDHIIDHLHDDSSALRACALTSRSWRPSSHYHLFRSLKITNLVIMHRLVHLLRGQTTVAKYVQELRYCAKEDWRFRSHPTWISAIAPALSALLPNVRILAFDYVEWVWPDYELPQEFLDHIAQFYNVKELQFYACNFSEFLNIDKFTTVFPSIERLSIDLCVWQDCRLENLNPKLALKSIHFGRHIGQITPMLWLEQTPSIVSLRDVSFSLIEEREPPFVGKFLRALGPSVHRLKIGCKFERNTHVMHDLDRKMSIAPLTSLSHLHIAILDLNDNLAAWVPILLTQAGALPVKTLKFDIWLHLPNQLSGYVWDLIVKKLWELTCKPSSSVKEVVFVHRGDLDFETAQLTLYRRIPFLYHKRMLHVLNRRVSG